jgi:predicted helicase
VFYVRRPEFDTADDKLEWVGSHSLSNLALERIEPDAKGNWINLTSNDWDSLAPVADKTTKAAKAKGQERSIFKQFSLGISTNRDEWLYDLDDEKLKAKTAHLHLLYSDAVAARGPFPSVLKSSATLTRHFKNREEFEYGASVIRLASYRPFSRLFLFASDIFIDRPGALNQCFPKGLENTSLIFSDPSSQKPWMALATDSVPDLHLVGAASASIVTPRYRYTPTGERIDNITDWAVATFTKRYGPKAGITRDAIFAYVYAALHDPLWRETYAINLKREFPRIPLHPDFAQWAAWGQTLLDLHIGYEGAAPWPLTRTDTPDARARAAGMTPRVILRADRDAGTIALDGETVLSGIPPQAWRYMLGNRSGIDWVLDQHKEKTPKDPTIRERFNTYRFADHKEKVVDLLARVTRVSVETVAITEAMKAARRTAAKT